MTWEPSSVHHSETTPPRAAQHLSLAERYATFAEYAASTASLPQTAATSLDVARFHAFTGEMTFSIDPAVRLYLDGGSIYHAERDGNPSLSCLILDAGVIDSVQLQRGVVGVGGVEHLGRLFDRDATVDRDAVMVVVENATDAIVEQLANSVTVTVTVSAYRHHPSGIHRWFVAPPEPTGVQKRPTSGVMQVDRSVVEELPRLGPPRAPQLESRPPCDPAGVEMRIEWAEPDPSGTGVTERLDDPSARTARVGPNVDIQAELDLFDADRADWTAAAGGDSPDASERVASPLGEFRIVWPDGTRDDSIVSAHPAGAEQSFSQSEPPANGAISTSPMVTEPTAPVPDPPVGLADPVAPVPVAPVPVVPVPVAPAPVAPVPVDQPTPLPIPVESPLARAQGATPLPSPSRSVASTTPPPHPPGSGPLGVTIEPLQIDRIPEPDAAVPEDVASAVRRVLQAIGNASSRPAPATGPERHLAPEVLPDLVMTSTADGPTAPTPVLVEPVIPPAVPRSATASADTASADTASADTASADTASADTAPGGGTLPTPVIVAPLPAVSGSSTETVGGRAIQSEPLGFAPPTADMRAEAVYERAAAQTGQSGSADAIAAESASSHPEPGKASIVFVDDEDDSQSERRSALRRLIGSLRNKG